jgi:hypothetical protein
MCMTNYHCNYFSKCKDRISLLILENKSAVEVRSSLGINRDVSSNNGI